MSWLYAEPPLRPVFAVVTGLIADEVPAGGWHQVRGPYRGRPESAGG